MSFYVDLVMLFVNLHVSFGSSRKCPRHYEDFFLWRLPIHFILTLADVMFYVNLHVTFRNSRMYPRYTILPCSRLLKIII